MTFETPFAAFVVFWFAGVSVNLLLYLLFVGLSTIRWIGLWS